MFPQISLPEIIVLGLLAIIFFGRDKLPDAAASFGKAFKSFKREISGVTESVNLNQDEDLASSEPVKKTKKMAKAK